MERKGIVEGLLWISLPVTFEKINHEVVEPARAMLKDFNVNMKAISSQIDNAYVYER